MSELYTTSPSPGKGQGLFANKQIEAGVRILDDELLFSTADPTENESFGEKISTSLYRLPPDQQQQFETLDCPAHPSWTPLERRYLVNCFETEKGESGICLKASRLNHSCCPNAFFAWSKDRRRVTVHAMEDIQAGEEITVSYVFPFLSRVKRQTLLRDKYAFECDCPACRPEINIGRSSLERRVRMESLFFSIDECNHGPSNNTTELELILEFIRLAKDERMDNAFLAVLCRRATYCYVDRRLKDMAFKYAEKEFETNKRLLGEDNALTKATVRRLKVLKIKLAAM